MTPEPLTDVVPDPIGLTRARELAQWELGDGDWAEIIVQAYLQETPEWIRAKDGLAGESA